MSQIEQKQEEQEELQRALLFGNVLKIWAQRLIEVEIDAEEPCLARKLYAASWKTP